MIEHRCKCQVPSCRSAQFITAYRRVIVWQARTYLASIALAMLLAAPAFAQTNAITFGHASLISADAPRVPHAETFLAVNPKNPENRLATSLAVEHGSVVSVVYATFDAGRTWIRSHSAPGDTSIYRGADPVVYFSPDGTAFFGTIQGTPIGFLLSRSTNGGRTWGKPITIPGGTYDREYLAFDNTNGEFHGRIYAGGTIRIEEMNGKRHNAIAVTSSTDSGRTFSPAKILGPDSAGEGIFVMADLLVAPNGTLVIPFSTYAKPQPVDSTLPGHLWTTTSEDGGLTFTPAHEGPARNAFAGSRGRWRLRSESVPRAAIDRSTGPHHGRLYVAWMSFADGKYTAHLAYSTDLGKSWSVPLDVNDNMAGGDPANPAVAVNDRGVVAVTFNDRRDDPKGECFRLYVAASVDGGATLLPNAQVSPDATCPNAIGNWALAASSFLDLPLDLRTEPRRPAITMLGIPSRWANGGDTQGLVATSDGRFHAAWIDGASGVMQLWSQDFAVNPTVARRDGGRERADVSAELTMELSDPVIDFTTHTLAVTVRLVNAHAVAIDGPFTIELHDVQSSLKDLRVANADNHLATKGAAWDLDRRAVALRLGDKTAPRTLCWTFAGDPPPTDAGEPLRAHFTILGKQKTGGERPTAGGNTSDQPRSK